MDIEKLVEGIKDAFNAHHAAGLIHVEPFTQMLQDNPDKAIDSIFKVYNNALDDAYADDSEKGISRVYIEAIAGGPCEIIPRAVYNTVGAVYSYLERPQKDRALRNIFDILDGLNYRIVNEVHTPGIREPLLLSDIAVCRRLYWPGLHDEEKLWKDKDDFFEIHEDIIDENGLFKKEKVTSDFLVGYALLRSDFTPFGEDYARAANSAFLERVMKGIVALRFATAENEGEIEEGKKRLYKLLPKSLHDRIEPIRQEADWVDYKKFN